MKKKGESREKGNGVGSVLLTFGTAAALGTADRFDGNAHDRALDRLQVGIPGGQSANGERVAVAESVGDALQPPAEQRDVRGGERDGQLLWRRIVACDGIGLEPVV